ncbi:hypothetical protein GCM10023185_01960 [Hymenobacter saemangeumensis]|uniref:T9SS type A sorting domain-containing protein n=1 Tax=Hymenobacter saemangeumensis TaxID=1084522 RepID=A0ABP8HXY1_9BACT
MRKYLTRFGSALVVFVLLLSGSNASAQGPTFDRAITCASGPGSMGFGPFRMVFDAQGNQYVAGAFGGSVLLGNTILSVSPNVRGLFVAKLDPQGNYLWATQADDNQDGYATVLTLDAAGDLYVGGGFSSFSLRLGPGVIVYNSSNNLTEGFVAKMDGSTGQWRWARRVGGTRDDYVNALAVMPSGDVYVVGNSESQVNSFGPGTPLNLPNRAVGTSSQYRDAYLAKLSATGTWLWARHVGNGNPYLGTLEVDPQGELYFTGTFTDSVRFGNTRLLTRRITGAPNPMGSDIFIAKSTAAGVWQWAVQGDALTQQNQLGGGVVSDGQGHLYFAGIYEGPAARLGNFVLPNQSLQRPRSPMSPLYTNNYHSDAFVARFDLGTQTWSWAMQRGGPYDEVLGQPAVDAQGRLYVTGTVTNVPQYGRDPELGQLDAATGAWQSSQSLIPLAYPILKVDRQNRLHLATSFSTPSVTLGAFTLQNAGPNMNTGVLARMTAGPLAATAASTRQVGLALWPNPASAGMPVQVTGPAPGQAVEVFDMLGRNVGRGRMPAQGPLALALPVALPAGVYVVRSGGQSMRLLWSAHP